MYTSDKSDALISCGGGELMCEILGYVDWDKIVKAEPKWFMDIQTIRILHFCLIQ